jgi:hypothetical protein
MAIRKFVSRQCVTSACALMTLLVSSSMVMGQAPKSLTIEKVEAGQFKSLTEPPCSYCSTQHRKGLVDGKDRVVAWIRAAHNGGAIPIRHFLAGPRVINDTYGLFFYDPDGGYVAAYKKDYGYELIGWRRGVMVVRGKDGTLWSALTGIAFEGPQTGRQLQRIPSLVTNWEHWMMLHPESTAYNLYDGKKYRVTPLPTRMGDEAKRSMGEVDGRLAASAMVLGVEINGQQKAYPLDDIPERACFRDKMGDQNIAVFWYGPTKTAVAFESKIGDQSLTLYADNVSPETAPFKDKETGTRWTLAGRAVDGPLRGKELKWVNSIQCRWYAWSAEYPKTKLHDASKTVANADAGSDQEPAPFHGALLSAEQVTESRLGVLKSSGVNAITLPIHNNADSREAERRACERIQNSNLSLYFWVEVARSPELANAHPDWMASLQGHTEWRRLFKSPPSAAVGEVVKTYPWVPILNKEPFAGQLSRIATLLQDRPTPDGVFLNDIQGAPSACGCGNHLCRWTSDYGKLRTTTPLSNDAPARFVAAVKKLVPHSDVIPVWTTECEEHDGAEDGLCAGVGCFKGICWKAYTAQLMPVANENKSLGVLLPYRSFQRDLPIYGPPAGWITHAVKSFEIMPGRHNGQPIPPSRLTAVLQGWDVTEDEISNQIEVARQAGVNRVLIAYSRIEQSWQPKIVNVD